MGPDGSQNFDVYLRTAVSVDPQGWAQFGYVKMPDYRWGIFLNPAEGPQDPLRRPQGRAGLAGRARRYRANLRRIIVTQGDTEPASVEQQRHLGLTCPASTTCATCSRSTSRKAATCGRWSTCCTSTSAATAARKARRCSSAAPANADNPRILRRLQRATPDWLSFFMFTYFTDRDGKFQLCALAESASIPGAHDKFMLTEEAHHMFVGESGVARVIQRTCAVMNELKTDDPASCARPA